MSIHGNMIDVAGTIEGETDKAIRFNDGISKVWLPKSQIEDNGDGTISMPEWLAQEKGLI